MKYQLNKQLKNILTILILFIVSIANAQNKPLFELPPPNGLVYDNTGFFKPDEKQYLNQKLIEFDSETSVQIVVAVTPSLFGYDIADYATRLLEKWRPGAKGKDNGFVILIKPKTKDSKGEVFISTGYGVEEFVTDAVAKTIVEKEIIPEFKKGHYLQGVDKGINVIMSLTRGEFTGTQYLKKKKKNSNSSPIIPIIIMIIVFIAFFGGRGNKHHNIGGRGSSLPLWLLLMSSSSGRSSGGFGGFSSGSGGFGGFGGGMGGGGGAGGSW